MMSDRNDKTDNHFAGCLKMKKVPRFRPSLSWETMGVVFKKMFLGKDKNAINRFETLFGRYIGVQNAIAVPSGRIGLYLILKHLGLKKGGEVLVPSFTYWVIPQIVSLLNLKPVFVDIDLHTCNLDISLLEEKITKNTKAIIPTHLYGLPCEMDFIVEIAKKYNLFVIEDCVQSCGAKYQNRFLGSIGEAGYFSFDITKTLSLMGGGMITTNNEELARKIKKDVAIYSFLTKRGVFKKILKTTAMKISTNPYIFSLLVFPLIRFFYRLDLDIVNKIFSEKKSLSLESLKSHLKLMPPEIQCELGRRQLKVLNKRIKIRRKNGNYLLARLKGEKNITLPVDPQKNIFTNFPIRTAQRELLVTKLLGKGIDVSKGYMDALGDSPKAKILVKEILHIPIYPFLKEKELAHIAETVKNVSRELNL